jgi:tellurite resistance protein
MRNHSRFSQAVVAACIMVSGCTHSGEIYDSKKHTKAEFSKGNTAAAVLGTAAAIALVAVAANNGGLGGGGYYGGG